MIWFNHSLIAGAACAVVEPRLVPVAVLGATAPDWLEKVANVFGARVPHRGPTHFLAAWFAAVCFALAVWDYQHVLLAFTLGGLSHILTDALTVSGVPVGPWSDRRFHLFGGRIRTGEPAEYGIALAFVGLCVLLMQLLGTGLAGGFAPFLYDWGGYYQSGLIDGSEWRTNRFRLL